LKKFVFEFSGEIPHTAIECCDWWKSNQGKERLVALFVMVSQALFNLAPANNLPLEGLLIGYRWRIDWVSNTYSISFVYTLWRHISD